MKMTISLSGTNWMNVKFNPFPDAHTGALHEIMAALVHNTDIAAGRLAYKRAEYRDNTDAGERDDIKDAIDYYSGLHTELESLLTVFKGRNKDIDGGRTALASFLKQYKGFSK